MEKQDEAEHLRGLLKTSAGHVGILPGHYHLRKSYARGQ